MKCVITIPEKFYIKILSNSGHNVSYAYKSLELFVTPIRNWCVENMDTFKIMSTYTTVTEEGSYLALPLNKVPDTEIWVISDDETLLISLSLTFN